MVSEEFGKRESEREVLPMNFAKSDAKPPRITRVTTSPNMAAIGVATLSVIEFSTLSFV